MAPDNRTWSTRGGAMDWLMAIAMAVTLLLGSFGSAGAQGMMAALPRIEANQNLSAAGELKDGTLTLRLVIREGEWYPEADTGPALAVQALAEEGRALQIPGPLIRVPAG